MLLSLLSCAAIPTTAGARGHSVRGSGKTVGGASFTLRADGRPGQASGHVRFEATPGFDEGGRVDCLAVDGNRAVLAGERKVGGFFWLEVEDHGSNKHRPRDTYRLLISNVYTPCTETLPNDDGFVPAPIRRGDVEVA